MAKQQALGQATSNRTEYVVIRDVNGNPITGLVYNSSGLIAYYVLPRAASASISLVTQTVTGAYSSGGFVEVDATHAPGLYRFDIPNAAFASGNDKAIVALSGYSGMAPLYLEYQITGYDPTGALSTYAGADTSGTTTLLSRVTSTRAGNLDNLDATVSSRSTYAGGDTSGTTTLLTRIPGTVQAQTGDSYAIVSSGTFGNAQLVRSTTPANTLTVDSSHRVAEVALTDTLTTYTGNTPQTGDAYARIGAAGAGLTALGDTRIANLDATVSSRSTYAGTDTSGTTTLLTRIPGTVQPQTGDSYARLGAPAGASVSADVAALKTDLDGGVSLTSGYQTTLVTAVWAAGTRTLTSLGTVVADTAAAVWAAATRTLTAFGFTVTTDISSTVTTNLNATVGSRLAASAYTAPDNTDIAAIKAKTDNLPASPAAVSDIPTANANADALLKRDWTAVSGEALDSVLNALRGLGTRNKVTVDYTGNLITVYKENGTTVAYTIPITTQANVIQTIVGVAP